MAREIITTADAPSSPFYIQSVQPHARDVEKAKALL